jgi:DNA-binding IclR family transcriptional regulator
MSLEAYIWAGSLRVDECDGIAFRVLLKYADRCDQYGRTAWYRASELAEDLGCSRSSIQRATKELIALGLMSKGDQRFVSHIPANYRPIVYDLETPAKRMQDAVRAGVPSLDTCTDQVSHGCTPGVSSGDTHRTVTNPSTKTSQHHPSLVTAHESAMSR